MKPGFEIDPILRKELRGSARRWQTYAVRVLYVSLIGVAVYNFQKSLKAYGPLIGPSEYANLGRTLFGGFLALQVPFMALTALAGGSSMIAKEARAGTLGLLSIAGLTPGRIAWGKWKAVTAQTTSLILCGTPILAISYYLGGVGFEELIFAMVATFSAVGVGGAFAICASARFPSTLRAMLWGFLAMLLYYVAVAMLCGFLSFPLLSGNMAEYFLASSLLVGVLSAFTIRWQLRRAAYWVIVQVQALAPPPTFTDFEAYERYYGTYRHPGLRHLLWRSGVWEDRPLLWKELVTRPAAKISDGQRAGILTGLGLLAAGPWFIGEGISPEGFPFVGIFFLVLAATNGAALFVFEREGHRWDVFLSAPVPGWRIVRAKLLGGLLATESLMGLAIFLGAILGFGRGVRLELLVLYGAVWTAFLAFGYVLGAAASLRAASFRAAVLVTLGILAGLLYGLAILLWILVPANLQVPLELRGTLAILGSLNPVTLVQSFAGPERQSTLAFGAFQGQTHPLLFFVFYGAGMAALIAQMSRRFDRIVGRA